MAESEENVKADGKPEKKKVYPAKVRGTGDGKFKHGDIVVVARPEKGFRRAGIEFPSSQETVVITNSLTEAEYKLIMGEPALVKIESKPAKADEKK